MAEEFGQEFGRWSREHAHAFAAMSAAAWHLVASRRARVVTKAAYLGGYTEELPEWRDDALVQYGEALTALADRRIAHGYAIGLTAEAMTRDGLHTAAAVRQNERRTAPHGAHTPPTKECPGEEGRPTSEGVGRATAAGSVEVRHHRRLTPA